MKLLRRAKAIGVVSAASLLVAGVAAGCGGSSTSSKSGSSGTFEFWDVYTQYGSNSPWAKQIQLCGREAGVKIVRSAYDGTDLVNKALLAGQQRNLPNVLVTDNPSVSTMVSSGILTTMQSDGLSTGKIASNILDAGVVNGKAYGIPTGADTLALYYNPKILKAAGVDPKSITSWAALTAALAKVKANTDDKGITFAGINTEEGSFQFLPWFWGAGASLTKLDSTQGIAALDLLVSWVKKGYAPNSVIQDNQTASFQEFQTGQYAFAENGTWQKALAAKMGAKVLEIPGEHGGSAPVPTGGEFFTIPVQQNTATYKTSAKIVKCLTTTDNIVSTSNALNYVVATQAGQAKQVKEDPTLKPWVAAVKVAKARTGDNLGTKYSIISQQLWTAVQKALSGSATPAQALRTAQSAAVSQETSK